ncbi:MAG TPA: hypothetical protein PLQ76_09760, partial [bacterium]|nr:hypothetical protein [bacterium]
MKMPWTGPKRIIDGVWLVGSSARSHVFDSSVYAVQCDGGVVLIDCGGPYGLSDIAANLDKA